MGTDDDASTSTSTSTAGGAGGSDRGGDGAVGTSDPPAGLAEQIVTGVTDGLRALLGGNGSGDAPTGDASDAGGDGASGETVTAPGRTRGARADTETDVAAQTRAALASIRADEARDERENGLRAEIEELKGTVTKLAEKPPEQYSKLNRAIWG